jgi:hypothetical protein
VISEVDRKYVKIYRRGERILDKAFVFMIKEEI